MSSEKLKRQRRKIQEIGEALVAAGLVTLDKQAAALGLVRSTAWSVLQATHKKSGLSTDIIIRMLSALQLPGPVRVKIVEYLREKCAGHYGHSDSQLRRFTAKLSASGLAAVIPDQCGSAKSRRNDVPSKHKSM
jgi:hypothetical protein